MSIFARKHYQHVAAALQSLQPVAADDASFYARRTLWAQIRDELADGFKRDNPRFDRDRFILSCDKQSNERNAA